MNNPYIGSSFDDFLEEEGILAETEATAIKRVVAFRVRQLMKETGVTKTDMAKRMRTSRAALDRLLDPQNKSVTLQTLEKAALALGKRIQIDFV